MVELTEFAAERVKALAAADPEARVLRLAVEGGDTKVPADMQKRLPYLLWLYQMAVILFWLYDRSPGQQRTQQLIEKSLGLIVTLVRLSTLPLMKPARKTVLELVETLAAAF